MATFTCLKECAETSALAQNAYVDWPYVKLVATTATVVDATAHLIDNVLTNVC